MVGLAEIIGALSADADLSSAVDGRCFRGALGSGLARRLLCTLAATATALLVCTTPNMASAQNERAPLRDSQISNGTPSEAHLAAGQNLPASDFDDRPLMFGAMLGFGTPVGLIGAVATYTVVNPVAFGIGAGTNGDGLQLTAMATFRPLLASGPTGAHAFTITPAWSMGPWRGIFIPVPLGDGGGNETVRQVSDQAHWVLVDGGYELVKRGGFWLRTAWGVGWMVNPGDAYCIMLGTGARTSCGGQNIEGEKAEYAILTITVVLGYALDI